MKAGLLGLGASFAVALLACGSSDEAPKYPDVASFCAQWAQEECQVASRCASVAATCTSQRQADCQTFAAAATGGTRTYHSDKAEDCINKIHDVYSAAASGSAITPSQTSDIADVCSRTFAGTVDKLQACTSDYDCADDRICDKKLCADKSVKNQGDLCGNPGEVCSDGSFCTAATGGASQCVAEGAQGAACSETQPCGPTLRCDNTCSARLGSGASCASDDDCSNDAPYCDPSIGNKCDLGITFAAGAAACKDYGG
ncbi:MAG TPA: hypothetical protein VF407_16865 [Polyangiaceae bacterium]